MGKRLLRNYSSIQIKEVHSVPPGRSQFYKYINKANTHESGTDNQFSPGSAVDNGRQKGQVCKGWRAGIGLAAFII